jgi:hypothetical protein
MNQSQLNREVARATGESLREIRRRGFSLANPTEVDFDPEPNWLPPQAVNWDQIDDRRLSLFPAGNIRIVPAIVGV